MLQSKSKSLFKNNIFKFFAVTAISAMLVAGLVYKFYSEKSPITDFVYSRDAESILKIFDKDWYWLVASSREEYSPDFMLKNRAYDRDPAHFGKLDIKVLRENNKLAGFTAYFNKKIYEGFLLYVGVDRDFRGEGYGEKLTNYAVEDMFANGCNIVKLITRTENIKARSLYKKLGFEETLVDGGYVYYTKYKK
ncbi:MAG: Ribosomal protein S18 alanine N-acetyltransferase [candidate division TM6 bacterium GW2011_GWF2_30_66]|jgi:ribosomal-protein-alanine N-acetyltransferase|nr:MAG: Ribosomal protein S18 alanine N-acetyltransferase [candidate division TM6 bacterium GW2011_GWF2_30_66]